MVCPSLGWWWCCFSLWPWLALACWFFTSVIWLLDLPKERCFQRIVVGFRVWCRPSFSHISHFCPLLLLWNQREKESLAKSRVAFHCCLGERKLFHGVGFWDLRSRCQLWTSSQMWFFQLPSFPCIMKILPKKEEMVCSLGWLFPLFPPLLEWSQLREAHFSLEKIEAHVFMYSPFGNSMLLRRNHLSKLMTVLGEDLPQFLVACKLMPYIGFPDEAWAIKLGMSMLAASFNLGKVLTHYVFGWKMKKASKFGIHVLETCCVGLLLSLMVTFSIDWNFCFLPKSIDTIHKLGDLCRCLSILNDTRIELESALDQQDPIFLATSVTAPLSIGNNLVNLNFVFNQLNLLNATIVIANNTGELILSFYPLESLIEGSGRISYCYQ